MSPGWSDTTTNYLQEVQDHGNLMREWWMTVFLPAINSLPEDSKTRLFNATSTALTTGILPTYVKIYPADVHSLNRAMHHMESGLNDHFSWYFICSKFGQRHEGMNHDGRMHLGWVKCPTSPMWIKCVFMLLRTLPVKMTVSPCSGTTSTPTRGAQVQVSTVHIHTYIYIYGISIQGKWGVATRRYVV